MTLDGELFMGRSRFCDTVSVVKSVGSKLWNSVTYEVDCSLFTVLCSFTSD